MTCSACGKANPADVVECESCGELLVDIFSASSPSRKVTTVASEEAASAVGGTEEPDEDQPVSTVMTAILPRHARFGDRYEILELIGEGGMGRVYKARDLELDRLIALKTIRSEKGTDPETVRRFKQELVLARRITHKNVVRIYDLGEAEGVKFFTMELLEGESLKKIIQKNGKMAVPTALAMIRQMLGALGEAHDQGVIHRDLKPQNIMVSPDGTPHIMDFGIARSAESAGMTATGSVLGTPDYISPEQVSGEETNAQTDLFSLGVIAYEMLTGKLPYDADTPIAKVMMRLNHKPQPLREINPEIPLYLQRMVLKCLEVDPALRYRSAQEVLDDLGREQVDRSWLLRTRRALSRRKASVAAAALVAILLGALAYRNEAGGQNGEAGVAGPAEPELVRTLAILPFVNATGSEELEWMRTGLAEMLVTDISQSRYVRPVPGERVFRLMRQLEIHEQSRFDEAALASIAQLAPADSILYGQFVQLGDSVRMDLTLRDSGSGVPTPIKVESNATEILSLIDRITEQVKEHLDLSPEQLTGDTDRPIADVATDSLEALRSYQAGLVLLRQDSKQGAIPMFQAAIEQDPEFAMAHAKLAECYLVAGELNNADVAIRRAAILSEQAPLPLAVRYQIHAISALISEDYETAANSYGELASLYPNDPDIQLSQARALEDLGRLPAAIEIYQNVIRVAPGYGGALLGLARSQVMSGRPEEAARTSEEALHTRQFEGDPEATGLLYGILGVAERDMGLLDESVEHLKLALQYREQAGDRQGQARALTNLAAIYEQRGQIEQALDAEQRALALSRETGNRMQESVVLYNMGLTYRFAGQLDMALQHFRDSLQIEMDRNNDRELAIRLGQIADVYRVRGQYADAVVYLEQGRAHLERSGDEIEKALNLVYTGQVKTAVGRNDEAVENLLAALAIFQETQYRQGVSEAQLRLSEAYFRLGRYAESYVAIQRSLEIYRELEVGHDLAEVKGHLGNFLVTVGRFDEAERELGEAREIVLEAHAKDLVPFISLVSAKLDRYRERWDGAAEKARLAKDQAEEMGQREMAMLAGLELGEALHRKGDLAAAKRLFSQARTEASRAGARPLEAEALAALAETHFADGEVEASYDAAQKAVAIAENISLRMVLLRALTTLGEVSGSMGRPEEASQARSRAQGLREQLRESLMPEHVASFLSLSGADGSSR